MSKPPVTVIVDGKELKDLRVTGIERHQLFAVGQRVRRDRDRAKGTVVRGAAIPGHTLVRFDFEKDAKFHVKLDELTAIARPPLAGFYRVLRAAGVLHTVALAAAFVFGGGIHFVVMAALFAGFTAFLWDWGQEPEEPVGGVVKMALVDMEVHHEAQKGPDVDWHLRAGTVRGGEIPSEVSIGWEWEENEDEEGEAYAFCAFWLGHGLQLAVDREGRWSVAVSFDDRSVDLASGKIQVELLTEGDIVTAAKDRCIKETRKILGGWSLSLGLAANPQPHAVGPEPVAAPAAAPVVGTIYERNDRENAADCRCNSGGDAPPERHWIRCPARWVGKRREKP